MNVRATTLVICGALLLLGLGFSLQSPRSQERQRENERRDNDQPKTANRDNALSIDEAAIDGEVREALKAWEVPGVAVGIVHNGRVVYLKGFGVKELGKDKPVTPDTLFPIASCTKMFTTTAMAMMVSEGRMHWDEPVRNKLPEFRLADPRIDALVTLRDLVCHRTGLGSHDLLWYRAPWDLKESIRRIGLVAPSLQFRSSFQYQSTMVSAAGLAVDKAAGAKEPSGAGWANFVQKRIFDPLGMDRCCFTSKDAQAAPDRASPHRHNKEDKTVVIPHYVFREPDPAGSIQACASDLCKWAIFQMGDGSIKKDGKTIQLVSRESLEVTHTGQNIIPLSGSDAKMQPETHQMTYGMGWVIQDYRGEKLVSHAGRIDGFRTHITLVPKRQLGIVLLNNLDATDMNLAISNTLVDKILRLPTRDWNAYLTKVYKERDDAAKAGIKAIEAKRRMGTNPTCKLEAYTGEYFEPAFGTARVTLENGRLVWHWSTFTAPLEHFHNDVFRAKCEIMSVNDPFILFQFGLSGDVAGMAAVDHYFIKLPRK
jgi:CubicO group peptidase (beta-lactamase class C family)